MTKHTFPNGFMVSIIKETDSESDVYNAAIVKEDTVVITELHGKTETFIIGSDFTFDLTDKRKITTFLKNVESLSDEAPFADVYMDENEQMVIGKKHPTTEKLLKIINKITPLKKVEDE
jgi:hypothetical protein